MITSMKLEREESSINISTDIHSPASTSLGSLIFSVTQQMSPPSTQQRRVSLNIFRCVRCAMSGFSVQQCSVFTSLSAPRRAVTARSSVYKLSVSGGAERWAPRVGSSVRNTRLDSPAQIAITFSHRKCYRSGKMFISVDRHSLLDNVGWLVLVMSHCEDDLSSIII